MRLSDGEKLIVFLLTELLLESGPRTSHHVMRLRTILHSGNYWALPLAYPNLGSMEIVEEVGREVRGILDMWEWLEHIYFELSADDKQDLQHKCQVLDPLRFPGFDAGCEGEHYSAAILLTRDLAAYPTFAGRDINSPWPMLDAYRRMYAVYRSIMCTQGPPEAPASIVHRIMQLA